MPVRKSHVSKDPERKKKHSKKNHELVKKVSLTEDSFLPTNDDSITLTDTDHAGSLSADKENAGSLSADKVNTSKVLKRTHRSWESLRTSTLPGSTVVATSPLTSHANSTPARQQQQQPQQSLQSRLEALTHIRETEPERLLREYRQATESKLAATNTILDVLDEANKSLDELRLRVRNLEADLSCRDQEISVLRAKLGTSRRESGRHDTSHSSIISDAKPENGDAGIAQDNPDQLINILSALSEISLSLDPELSQPESGLAVYQCLQSGPSTIFKYTLELNQAEPDLLVYTPLPDDQDNRLAFKHLPVYFREPLTFRWNAVSILVFLLDDSFTNQAHQFYWKIVQALHAPINNDDEDGENSGSDGDSAESKDSTSSSAASSP